MTTRNWLLFVYTLLLFAVVTIVWMHSPGPCTPPDAHHHVNCVRR